MFTPYYSEIVLYSTTELQEKNEDGISILFYLQKIYPGMPCLCLVFLLYFIAQLFIMRQKNKRFLFFDCSKHKVLVLVLFKEK